MNMIAEVIPQIRLPRRFSFFDYLYQTTTSPIPTSNVGIGDVVRISFKNREILGVVRGLRKESDTETWPLHSSKSQKTRALLLIKEVIEPKFLSSDDIKRIESIAANIAQSPSTILHTALFGFQNKKNELKQNYISYPKLTINKQTAKQVSEVMAKLKNENELFYQTNIEGALTLAYALTKQFKNQILILAPHERNTKIIHKLINFKSETAILHGKCAPAERNAIIRDWQSGKIKVLISTRQGSLLPAKKIDAVLVIDADSIDHKNWDRNPRYDARLAVNLLAKQHQAKLVYTGYMPRLLDIFEKKPIIFSRNTDGQIINLSAHEEYSGIPLISDTLKNKISEVLKTNKQTLLVYNRKGVANRLQCNICGHIPFCGTCGANPVVRASDLLCPVCKAEMWIPKKCPACGSDKLKPRGVGNKKIKTELQKVFPGKSISIVDKQNIENLNADILIVTEYYFHAIHYPFMKKKFGLIADICIDLGLGGNYDSSEITAMKLNRLLAIAEQQKADCIIQTWIPDEIKKMLSLIPFLKSELQIRSKYRLFPAFEVITVRAPGKNFEDVVRSSTVKMTEKMALTTIENSCIIDTELRNYDT